MKTAVALLVFILLALVACARTPPMATMNQSSDPAAREVSAVAEFSSVRMEGETLRLVSPWAISLIPAGAADDVAPQAGDAVHALALRPGDTCKVLPNLYVRFEGNRSGLVLLHRFGSERGTGQVDERLLVHPYPVSAEHPASGRYACVGHDLPALGESTGVSYDLVFDGANATLYHQGSDAAVRRIDFHLTQPGMYGSDASNFRNLEVVPIARPGKGVVQGLRVLRPYCYDYLVPVEDAR